MAAGYRSLLAFWIGGIASTPVPPVPPVPPISGGWAFMAQVSDGATDRLYYWEVAAVPGVSSTVPSPGPGIRRYQWGCQNWYDHCLGDEHRFMQTFQWPAPGCCLPVSYSTGGMPWEVMPGDGTEFRKQFNIPLPATEGSNILLGSFRVPQAYDGLIYGIMTAFTGLGFFEGSGDLIWRVEKNRRFMKDLSFIDTSLGSFSSGVFPLTPHERIWSSDTLNLYIYLGSGALGRLDPNGYVSITLTGYYFPRPGPRQSRLRRRNDYDRSNFDWMFWDRSYRS